ncbi:MAG: NUDIX hydrolase [Polyangiaceae bacterium]|jgi:ADP-ribose pyrophosphatase
MARVVVPPPRIRKWRQLHREPVGSFRILDVERVGLEDGDGRARGDAFTIRCRDWCNVVAVTPDDHVVLVWQYRFGTDAFSLEIPGGVIDDGEAPHVAARRELREETGYEAETFEPLLTIEPNPAIQNNRCFTFVARNARPTAGTGFDAQEELETALLPAARIGDLLDSGQVTHALVQGALEAYLRKSKGDSQEKLLGELEALQRRKVLELARRLRPGLTLEDVLNPHDFPELDDRDWQYEDGVLTGIESVLAAFRAQRRESEDPA